MSSLPPDLEQFMQDQLAQGKYQSASEMLGVAVRLLRDREVHLETLRREVDRGIAELDAGEGIELNSEAEIEAFFDDIESRGQQRLSAKRTSQ
jgi:antitoxin ParD1/3/4